ncbi:glycoside hydrolase family 3 protein [Riemerella columbina]|uniref:glycoside hydrolase family 3 protein n=1 Tax=Riemerella columbina TaxID=103810 RepID=UPI0003678E99|nr:glycoside hydrolase family 3 N-terminal domain-containing protein [Riemerella columbina]
MKLYRLLFLALSIYFLNLNAQYQPKENIEQLNQEAETYAEQTYQKLSLEDKIGQLFIVALYNNKGNDFIQNVRNLVEHEHIGGLILMQDDARKHIELINEFQAQSKIPLMIGMDAEWGLYQRLPIAHKFPWAMTLGAIQDPQLIYEMSSQIAQDCKRMGIYWDFAPVVDVNTNPKNPIIGNRSFGSNVNNVISKALAYSQGLQDHGVLASIKHFPGHGDTDTDSHLDLPVVAHSKERLEQMELAPFKALMNKNIGGVMIAHLYIPALEPQKSIPGSLSHHIITDLLKHQYQYNGLIITDALNMNAVAKKFSPGVLDLMAFKAGNDIMLFSQDVPSGRRLIKQALMSGDISEQRLKESVIKILKTKYLLGLTHQQPIETSGIEHDLNNDTHRQLSEKLYANALTALKDNNNALPLRNRETYYYLPLEEAPYQDFINELNNDSKRVTLIKESDVAQLSKGAKVIVGFHKDNSTAYKPYKISYKSKQLLKRLSQQQQVILVVFGSPYALKDIDISAIPTVLVAYENNPLSMKATAKALKGMTKIHGRLPVVVNEHIKEGMGIDIICPTEKDFSNKIIVE